jgi:hypothetical protein
MKQYPATLFPDFNFKIAVNLVAKEENYFVFSSKYTG